MISFFKNLFKIGSKPATNFSGIDKKYDCIVEKKNKLNVDGFLDEVFYVHTEPDPIRSDMSSEIIERDNINTSTVQVFDKETGKMVEMDLNTAASKLEQHSDGVFVPGLGHIGGTKAQAPRQQPQQNNAPRAEREIPLNSTGAGKAITVGTSEPTPPSEIILTGESYHLYVDLAGVKKEHLKMKFLDSVLIISGKRSSMSDEYKLLKNKSKKTAVVESVSTLPAFMCGTFSYKYPFKKHIDESSITAELLDGLLHVILPLRAKGDIVEIAII